MHIWGWQAWGQFKELSRRQGALFVVFPGFMSKDWTADRTTTGIYWYTDKRCEGRPLLWRSSQSWWYSLGLTAWDLGQHQIVPILEACPGYPQIISLKKNDLDFLDGLSHCPPNAGICINYLWAWDFSTIRKKCLQVCRVRGQMVCPNIKLLSRPQPEEREAANKEFLMSLKSNIHAPYPGWPLEGQHLLPQFFLLPDLLLTWG